LSKRSTWWAFFLLTCSTWFANCFTSFYIYQVRTFGPGSVFPW
jgi:hypothetical protein